VADAGQWNLEDRGKLVAQPCSCFVLSVGDVLRLLPRTRVAGKLRNHVQNPRIGSLLLNYTKYHGSPYIVAWGFDLSIEHYAF